MALKEVGIFRQTAWCGDGNISQESGYSAPKGFEKPGGDEMRGEDLALVGAK